MRKLILISALLMAACTSHYDYRVGSNASPANWELDNKQCEDAAFKRYFEANPSGRIGLDNSSLGGLVVTGFVKSAVHDQGSKGPPMKEEELGPLASKCMRDKGYIEKLQ